MVDNQDDTQYKYLKFNEKWYLGYKNDGDGMPIVGAFNNILDEKISKNETNRAIKSPTDGN